MIYHDYEYHKLLTKILKIGEERDDRTGVGTLSIFSAQMEFMLGTKNGILPFPLLTGKRVHWKSVVEELLWFLRGETNIKTLNATIWDEWCDENGECGPIYGHAWRNFGATQKDLDGIDQIHNVIENIKTNPHSRRLVVSAWDVKNLDKMALPPCHLMFQFYVRGNLLDCQMYQRSVDVFLGCPFNIASYSLLTYIIAYLTGLKPGRFIWIGGDCHIYNNHHAQVNEYLSRKPFPSPTLILKPGGERSIDNWTFEDFALIGYKPYSSIKAPVAV